MNFIKRIDHVVAFILSTLLVSALFGSCKLEPEFELERIEVKNEDIDTTSAGPVIDPDLYSFPVVSIDSIDKYDLDNKLIAIIEDSLMVVISPSSFTFKVVNIGAGGLKFLRVSPDGDYIAYVTEESYSNYTIVGYDLFTSSVSFSYSITMADISDLEWDPSSRGVYIVGSENSFMPHKIFKFSSSAEKVDVTSTFVDLSGNDILKGNGVIEIESTNQGYGLVYSSVEYGGNNGNPYDYEFALYEYDNFLGFEESRVISISSFYEFKSLITQGDGRNIVYRLNTAIRKMETRNTISTELDASKIHDAISNTLQYALSNDGRYIYSVRSNDRSIWRYDIQNGNLSTLSISIVEPINMRNFHFVK